MQEIINVLVTGANGQLGQTIREQSKSTKNINWFFFDSEQLDITNANQVDKVFKENKPHYCINCAAYTNVEKAEKESKKAYSVNLYGVQNLADASKKHETILVHISTDYVFDGKKQNRYFEADETKPVNVYGKTKQAGEQYISKKLKEHFIIRTSWLFSEYGNNFLKTITSKLITGEALNINNIEVGTPTSCNLVFDFINQLITTKNSDYGKYHLTSLGDTTWCNYAIEIKKALEKLHYTKGEVFCNNYYKTIAQRPLNTVLSLDKTLRIFPSIPDWKEEVAKTVVKLLNKKGTNNLNT